MSKIFGIGLSKTGTTSLTKALEILGFSAIHLPENLGLLSKYDCATDLPIAIHYKKLDEQYPNSKFILTVRKLDDWLVSMKSHFERLPPSYVGEYYVSLRKLAYGKTEFDEKVMRESYIRHVANVNAYFANRPKDLLIFDICGGEAWDSLCDFLAVKPPDIPFPYSNRDPS